MPFSSTNGIVSNGWISKRTPEPPVSPLMYSKCSIYSVKSKPENMHEWLIIENTENKFVINGKIIFQSWRNPLPYFCYTTACYKNIIYKHVVVSIHSRILWMPFILTAHNLIQSLVKVRYNTCRQNGIWQFRLAFGTAFSSPTPRVHNKRLGDSYVSSTKCMVQTGVATIIILWTHTPTPPLPHIPKNVMRHLF